MQRFWRSNGLSIVLLALFAISLVGQSITGMRNYNEDQREHGEATVSYTEYLVIGSFIESVFKN